jgi:serine/threonine-protein kinase
MMDTNPYKAPTANVEVEEVELEIPKEIATKIKGAWIAGLVSAGFTMIFVVLALMGTSLMGIDGWGGIDAAMMAALSFGVFRKSRTCAILLLALFTLNKVLMWVAAGSVAGLPLSLVFFYFFIQGVVGTFQFHKWKRESAETSGSGFA